MRASRLITMKGVPPMASRGPVGGARMPCNWLKPAATPNRVCKKRRRAGWLRGGVSLRYFKSSIVQQLRGLMVSLVILVSGP